MTRKFGFTLAEVLITLGIIGVVAAMTMPTLMNSTQGAQYKTAFKKSLSVLSQAVTLNMALEEWNLAELDASHKLGDLLEQRTNIVRKEDTAANVKLADGSNPYKATVAEADKTKAGVSGDQTIADGNMTVFFNDGIMFTFPASVTEAEKNGCSRLLGDGTQSATFKKADHPSCFGFVDTNGIKGPNKIVKCDAVPANGTCTVSTPTDVFPVMFYDQSVLPATTAATAVLYGK